MKTTHPVNSSHQSVCFKLTLIIAIICSVCSILLRRQISLSFSFCLCLPLFLSPPLPLPPRPLPFLSLSLSFHCLGYFLFFSFLFCEPVERSRGNTPQERTSLKGKRGRGGGFEEFTCTCLLLTYMSKNWASSPLFLRPPCVKSREQAAFVHEPNQTDLFQTSYV